MGLFEKVFGTHSEKELKKIKPLIDKIEAMKNLKLRHRNLKTDWLRVRPWTICW